MCRFSGHLVAAILLVCMTAEPTSATERDGDVVVTLIFTNDTESAYDPVPAWWIEGMDRIGGIAELATLIGNIRRDEPNVFLFVPGIYLPAHYRDSPRAH